MERNSESKQEKENLGIATLPYVKNVTERIQRILQSHDVVSSVKPFQTLKQQLSHPKDMLPKEKRVGVVYEIPCGNCDVKYIGETGRSMLTRQKEHMASVRLGKTENSALAEHANKLNRLTIRMKL